MNIIWLGHASFRLEIGTQVLLVDPWLGNPMFPADKRTEALEGITAVLLSHGHSDHIDEAGQIAKAAGVPLVGKVELVKWIADQTQCETIGYNNGGTVRLGDVAVTMVAASHSSSAFGPNGPIYLGTECGFMIEHDGRTIYYSGDTDVMADMGVFNDLHAPEIGILAAGGHYTMDMKRAAYAVRKFFNFKTVIPCHYRTFSALEQNADALRAGVPVGVQVIEPEVLEPIRL